MNEAVENSSDEDGTAYSVKTEMTKDNNYCSYVKSENFQTHHGYVKFPLENRYNKEKTAFPLAKNTDIAKIFLSNSDHLSVSSSSISYSEHLNSLVELEPPASYEKMITGPTPGHTHCTENTIPTNQFSMYGLNYKSKHDNDIPDSPRQEDDIKRVGSPAKDEHLDETMNIMKQNENQQSTEEKAERVEDPSSTEKNLDISKHVQGSSNAKTEDMEVTDKDDIMRSFSDKDVLVKSYTNTKALLEGNSFAPKINPINGLNSNEALRNEISATLKSPVHSMLPHRAKFSGSIRRKPQFSISRKDRYTKIISKLENDTENFSKEQESQSMLMNEDLKMKNTSYFHECKTCFLVFTKQDELNEHMKSHEVSVCVDPHGLDVSMETQGLGASVDSHDINLAMDPEGHCVSMNTNSGQTELAVEPSVNSRTLNVYKKVPSSPAKCPLCFKSFKSKSNLNTHLLKFHKDRTDVVDRVVGNVEEQKKKRTECYVCQMILSTKQSLIQHMEARHSINKTIRNLKCFFCFQSERCEMALLQHMETKHDIGADRKCKTCGQIFEKLETLLLHILSHKENKINMTKKEDKLKAVTTNSLGSLNESIKPETSSESCQKTSAQEEEPKLVCNYCPLKFGTLEEIVKHTFVHAEIPPVQRPTNNNESQKCPVCEKVIHSSLSEHMRSHSDNRPFVCEICNARFKRNHQMKLHKQTVHSDIRLYHCELCEKSFKRKDKLTCHYRTHSNDHPFMCPECGSVFKWKHHLKRHKDNVHADKATQLKSRKYSCFICGNAFKWRHHLKRHLRNVHRIEDNFEELGDFNNSFDQDPVEDIASSPEPPEESMDLRDFNNDVTRHLYSMNDENVGDNELRNDGESEVAHEKHDPGMDEIQDPGFIEHDQMKKYYQESEDELPHEKYESVVNENLDSDINEMEEDEKGDQNIIHEIAKDDNENAGNYEMKKIL